MDNLGEELNLVNLKEQEGRGELKVEFCLFLIFPGKEICVGRKGI